MRAGDILAERFEIEQPVTAGGMGYIYRARDRWSGDAVALKILTHRSAGALDRFLQEAMVLAEIHHPGIVRYVAHGRTPAGAAYLAMEWLEGEDLSDYLERHGSPAPSPDTLVDSSPVWAEETPAGFVHTPSLTADTAPPAPLMLADLLGRMGHRLSVEQTLVLGRRLASAVAELHRRGIVHRDIKPSNLFLPDGAIEQLKVLDLGTAWRQGLDEDTLEARMLVGTPYYMAPEQARKGGEITPATDVWAMGCVLYQCLAGARPFGGDDAVAVLARIVMDTPAPLHAVREDVPAALASLILRTLEKRPERRPADAAVLAEMLESADAPGRMGRRATSVSGRAPSIESAPLLTASESRVTCVLLADAADPEAMDDDAVDGAVSRAARPWAAHVQRLASGTLLVTIPGMHPPTDQATRAARTALALRDAFPGLRMVLATGRAEGRSLLGHTADEAAQALRATAPGTIRVDAMTASLLDARFHIQHQHRDRYLTRERSLEATRTLLGKPTPWVGRQREMTMLTATFEQCVEEEVARVVLVTAPAGMGKSRLRHELERVLRASGRDVEIVHGRGDLASAGSPFALIAPAVRQMAGIRDGEPQAACRDRLAVRLAETVPAEAHARVTAFLGELAGVPFPAEHSDALMAARKDAMLMGQLVQAAWQDWLRAECEHRPVLLVLEDLHWGDLPSVRLVDGALQALADRPLMVLALARPEVSVVFPRLWERHGLHELRLTALSRRAGARIARAVLGEGATDALVDTLVARADGNAFYLEELIRAAAESGAPDRLPDTVVAMVQARLDALSPDAKLVLRAASVFGEVFWLGGVAALSGEDGIFHVREWLDDLVARELVVQHEESRIPGEAEYAFRHGLVRDAAYAMLTEEDCRLGHALAGAWLEAAGERDGRVMAEHFERGGQPERAVPHFHRAAEKAMEGNDLAAVIRLAERGIEAGARGEERGHLRALQAAASSWLSYHPGGRQYGMEAAALLAPGSARWFAAMGCAMVSSARVGDRAQVEALLRATMEARSAPGGGDAETEQLIALCRITYQLLFNGYYDRADEVLARITVLAAAAEPLDALTYAQVHHLQSLRRGLDGDIIATLHHLTTAADAFERAGDIRQMALVRSALAWWWAELGYPVRAAEICEQNLVFCEQQNARQALTFAKVSLGAILSQCEGRTGDARRLLHEAIAECHDVGNVRLEGWAHTNLAGVEHLEGRHEIEEREAARAVALLDRWPSFQAWALAAHARALLALGRADEALAQARGAMDMAERIGGLIHDRSLPPLMLARALHATGDGEGARAAILDAAARIERRAARLDRPEWRRRFLARPDIRQTLTLTRTWAD